MKPITIKMVLLAVLYALAILTGGILCFYCYLSIIGKQDCWNIVMELVSKEIYGMLFYSIITGSFMAYVTLKGRKEINQ